MSDYSDEEYYDEDERSSEELPPESGFGSMVSKKIQAKLNAKSDVNSGALITDIHPEIITKYNSVNVIVGKQSLGKTVVALEEIIKIGYMHTHHLLIYVTKDGEENDRSWQTLKSMIELPIVLVSEENAKACVEELIQAKSLYYKVRRERTKNYLDPEQKEDLFEVLAVDSFERPYLHTIILFDDISNSKLFSSEESFFSQLLRRCRHNNLTFYLLIQGWKGIKPHIKNEITTLFIFPGFNKQQLRFIYSQSASNLDFDDFYKVYKDINNIKKKDKDAHPILIVQCTDGGDTYVTS